MKLAKGSGNGNQVGANEVCKWADEMGEIQVNACQFKGIIRSGTEHIARLVFLGRRIQARVRSSLFE